MFKMRVKALLVLVLSVFTAKSYATEIELQDIDSITIQQELREAGFSNDHVFEVEYIVATGEYKRNQVTGTLEMIYHSASTDSTTPQEGDRKTYTTRQDDGHRVYEYHTESVYMDGEWVTVLTRRVYLHVSNKGNENETN